MEKVKLPVIIVALLAFFSVASFIFTSHFPAPDWQNIYLPAVVMWMRGANPYFVKGFANPIWSMFLLAPFAFVPDKSASSFMSIVSALSFLYVCYRFEVGRIGTLLFILSASAFSAYFSGNIEPVLLLGIFLPPNIGLPVLALKPQVSIGYAIYQMYVAWRDRTILSTFAPLAFLSFLTAPYLPMILENSRTMIGQWWNTSFFPFSLPLGLALLVISILTKKPVLALATGVFISPYAALYSYTAVQVACAAYGGKHKNTLLFACFIISWIVQFWRL